MSNNEETVIDVKTNAGALTNLVKRVLPFTEKKSGNRPLLQAVKFFEAGGKLHACATDSYRLIFRQVESQENSGDSAKRGFEALINAEQLKSLLPFLRAGGKAAPVYLGLGENHLRVQMLGETTTEMHLPLITGVYPNVEKLLPNTVEVFDSAPVILNAAFLKDTNPGGKLPHVEFQQLAPGKAILFSENPELELGLIMPIRRRGNEQRTILSQLENWHSKLNRKA